MKNNNAPAPLPIEKKFVRFFLSIIKYPFRIAKKYESYNKGIADLISVKNEPNTNGKDDAYFRNFQKKNSRLIFFFIYMPIILGTLISGLIIYQSKENYTNYYHELTSPIKEERFTKKMGAYFSKVSYAVIKEPVTVHEFTPFFIFYIVSLMGAKFLSRNPAFKIEEEIKKKLTVLGYTDIEGHPWRVVWTPEAMLLVSFGKDPNQLAQEQKFWATINFPPSLPKQSKKDMNKFVVQRKYELSSNMLFKLGERHES